jgi:hypothetical protein
MRYTDFRDRIRRELRRNRGGLTWTELRQRLDLPYTHPCPEWTEQLEEDIGLRRVKGAGKALIWRASARPSIAQVTDESKT